jgi:hypothetical protein
MSGIREHDGTRHAPSLELPWRSTRRRHDSRGLTMAISSGLDTRRSADRSE